jgi:glycosyltransferase involved in cell wall biosynthesis
MKKKVIFRAPLLTQSGYGVHARQIAKWLLTRDDFDVTFFPTPWGETPWILKSELDNTFFETVLSKISQEKKSYDLSFQLQLPNEWSTNLAEKNIGITAAVESDVANPEWVKCCNEMSHVIFPSQHALNSIKNAGELSSSIGVHVIPESFNDFCVKEKLDLELNFETKFNFLIFGQITGANPESDRKNIFYTVKWICETFKDDPDVGIVIKTNAGRNSKIDKQIVSNMFRGFFQSIQKTAFPKVYLLHGDMNDHEVASLYKEESIKALVSLTKGEGFGLPILEAAACALPVIATGWSGHTEFLNLGKYINVFYKLAQIPKSRVDNSIFVPNARWANVSEEDFKKKILKFRNSCEIPQQWAKDLQSKIVDNYSQEKINIKYNDFVKGVI